MPPQVPYYDPNSPGLQYDLDAAQGRDGAVLRARRASTSSTSLGVGRRRSTSRSRQILQQSLEPLGINVTIKKLDPTTQFAELQKLNYSMAHSYWTMDIADPDELVTFAMDPDAGSHSFFTDYNNEDVDRGDEGGAGDVRPGRAPGALLEDPDDRRGRRLHGLPVLLPVPLRVLRQAATGFFVYPTGQLPHGGRLALAERPAVVH